MAIREGGTGRFVSTLGNVDWNDKAFNKKIKAILGSRLAGSAELLRKTVVKNISKPFQGGGGSDFSDDAFGDVQTRYGPEREGTPSKPGDPPKADLGLLRQSIFADVDKKQLTAEVGTTVKYGRALELGKKKKGKRVAFMAPRPFLRPALEDVIPRIQKFMNKPTD